MKQALRYNNKVIKKIYQGDELVKKMNYGQSSDVFQYIKNDGDTPTPPAPSYDEQYLTIESTSDNNTIYWKKRASNKQGKTISASTDDGSTWIEYTSTSGNGITIATLNSGDKLLVKGENATYFESWNPQGIFGSTSSFIVYGNVMSLVYGDNFSGQTTLTSGNTFDSLFSVCTGLTSAENLVLPATTMTNNCYQSMFYGCASLTTAPELPATTLAESCYNGMFMNCSSLTTAPELPATTLANYCYYQMFAGCTSLTTAPQLPATTLVTYCYENMFNGCTNINSIPCLATDISASNCTAGWVDGVAASGNFYVPSGNPASWKCGIDGVPSDWTIVDTNGDTYECTGGGPSTDVPLKNSFAVKVNGEWHESMNHIASSYDIEDLLGGMDIDPSSVEELVIGNETFDEINLDGANWRNCTGLTLAPNVQMTSDIHNFPAMQWVNVMSRQLDHQGSTRLFSDMNCCPIYVPEDYFSYYQTMWSSETTDDCGGSVADRLVAWTNPNN